MNRRECPCLRLERSYFKGAVNISDLSFPKHNEIDQGHVMMATQCDERDRRKWAESTWGRARSVSSGSLVRNLFKFKSFYVHMDFDAEEDLYPQTQGYASTYHQCLKATWKGLMHFECPFQRDRAHFLETGFFNELAEDGEIALVRSWGVLLSAWEDLEK